MEFFSLCVTEQIFMWIKPADNPSDMFCDETSLSHSGTDLKNWFKFKFM